MAILKGLLLFVEFTTCVLLITVVLLQKTKGGGMGAIGGGMGEAIFGAQMGNVLSRTTVILAIIFLVNTTVLALLSAKRGGAPVVGSAPGAAAPAMPGPEQPMSTDVPAGGQVPVPAIPLAPEGAVGGEMPAPIVIPDAPPAAPATN